MLIILSINIFFSFIRGHLVEGRDMIPSMVLFRDTD